MSLHPQFARPRSLERAIALLDNLGVGATLIAGGQELMPHLNYGRLMPSVIVDIGALAELEGVNQADGVISIGALTVHRRLQTDPLIVRSVPLLSEAASQVGGGWQVHNRGTIGGNIVSMHPLYDLVPPLLALNAHVEIAAPASPRRISLAALIQETSHGLGSRAILTRIVVSPQPDGAGWSYQKLKFTDGSYGSANAAALVVLDASGRIAELNVVIGGVADRPIDASDALRRELVGGLIDHKVAERLEKVSSSLVTHPLADQQGGAEYRRAMAGVMARRAIIAAAARAAKAGKED